MYDSHGYTKYLNQIQYINPDVSNREELPNFCDQHLAPRMLASDMVSRKQVLHNYRMLCSHTMLLVLASWRHRSLSLTLFMFGLTRNTSPATAVQKSQDTVSHRRRDNAHVINRCVAVCTASKPPAVTCRSLFLCVVSSINFREVDVNSFLRATNFLFAEMDPC